MPKKVSDETLLAEYERLKSVWKVGETVGMSGQQVHERLKKYDVVKPINVFTDEDSKYLKERYVLYRDAGMLQTLADEMGRTKQFICRQARKQGLTDVHTGKPKKFEWDKVPQYVAAPIWEEFKRSRDGLNAFCKRKHYNIQSFVDCMSRNFPDEYQAAIDSKKPKCKAYQRGRDFEYRVKRDMESRGYMVLRSPASKSKVDLYCIKRGELVFIQCKLHGQIGVSEWNEFYELCLSVGALPILAETKDREILYSEVIALKDGSRRKQPKQEWIPPERMEHGTNEH